MPDQCLDDQINLSGSVYRSKKVVCFAICGTNRQLDSTKYLFEYFQEIGFVVRVIQLTLFLIYVIFIDSAIVWESNPGRV